MASLKKLWLDGLTASQIAKQLGGVTRNAVIGKVHRLGLSGARPRPRRQRAGVQGAARRPRPQLPAAHAPRRAEPAPQPRPEPLPVAASRSPARPRC